MKREEFMTSDVVVRGELNQVWEYNGILLCLEVVEFAGEDGNSHCKVWLSQSHDGENWTEEEELDNEMGLRFIEREVLPEVIGKSYEKTKEVHSNKDMDYWYRYCI